MDVKFSILFCLVLLPFVISSEEESVKTSILLTEYNLVELCADSAFDVKPFYLKRKGIESKTSIDKEIAKFELDEASNLKEYESLITSPEFKRKFDLLSTIGDNLLEAEEIDQIIDFKNNIENILVNGKISCNNDSKTCQLGYEDILDVLSTSPDIGVLERTWSKWANQFDKEKDSYSDILKFIPAAATANGFNDTSSYWEMLAEYPGGYKKVEKIWEKIKPLYLKLHSFVKKRIEKAYGLSEDNKEIPVYLLGSFFGEDWSNIADFLLPHPFIVNEFKYNLKDKNIHGKELYKMAESLMEQMDFGNFNEAFWKGSHFDSSCPSKLLRYCQNGNSEILTCNKPSLTNYLEAHELAMRIVHMKLAGRDLGEDNVYILHNANRYSAVYEAIEGLGSLFALNPDYLLVSGLVPSDVFTDSEQGFPNRMTLILISALRTLPKLAYYLSADQFRLNPKEGSDIANKWWQLRKEHQMISSVTNKEWDMVNDIQITPNNPYIGKFLGTILQFQIFEKLQNDIGDYNFIEEIKNHHELKELMMNGMVEEWPKLLNKFLSIEEIDPEPLLKYFKELEDYMETAPVNQITASTRVTAPPRITTKAPKITVPTVLNDESTSGDSSSHLVTKSSAEIQNDEKIASGNRKDNETTPDIINQSYLWIGLGVGALLIVSLAVIIVVRKRRGYRKKKQTITQSNP